MHSARLYTQVQGCNIVANTLTDVYVSRYIVSFDSLSDCRARKKIFRTLSFEFFYTATRGTIKVNSAIASNVLDFAAYATRLSQRIFNKRRVTLRKFGAHDDLI